MIRCVTGNQWGRRTTTDHEGERGLASPPGRGRLAHVLSLPLPVALRVSDRACRPLVAAVPRQVPGARKRNRSVFGPRGGRGVVKGLGWCGRVGDAAGVTGRKRTRQEGQSPLGDSAQRGILGCSERKIRRKIALSGQRNSRAEERNANKINTLALFLARRSSNETLKIFVLTSALDLV